MNAKGTNMVTIGSEKTRKQQKYPDTLYLNFMSNKAGVSIDVTTIFERSKKEKIEDLRIALE